MSFTVGMRVKKRVAERLRMEWSSKWRYTHIYGEEEEAEEKRQEWLRNPANRELDFKVIELEEAHEKEWITADTPCSDPRCLR